MSTFHLACLGQCPLHLTQALSLHMTFSGLSAAPSASVQGSSQIAHWSWALRKNATDLVTELFQCKPCVNVIKHLKMSPCLAWAISFSSTKSMITTNSILYPSLHLHKMPVYMQPWLNHYVILMLSISPLPFSDGLHCDTTLSLAASSLLAPPLSILGYTWPIYQWLGEGWTMMRHWHLSCWCPLWICPWWDRCRIHQENAGTPQTGCCKVII